MLNKEQRLNFLENDHPKFKIILQLHVNELFKYSYQIVANLILYKNQHQYTNI